VFAAAAPRLLDVESREWLRDLRARDASADDAVARLHALLVRAATFEVRRRWSPHVRGDGRDLALEAAGDALTRVLAHLEDFRGQSRFETWAYKFALVEAAVKLRRQAWQTRELPTAAIGLKIFADMKLRPDVALEQRELLDTVHEGIEDLPSHQRDVLIAVALNEVPVDVLAERWGTSRSAIYKTLHDARVTLRRHVSAAGIAVA
jgi:RNA polymerase sigma-70 factor (ECF subfamily)